jgi:hypothetical protein
LLACRCLCLNKNARAVGPQDLFWRRNEERDRHSDGLQGYEDQDSNVGDLASGGARRIQAKVDCAANELSYRRPLVPYWASPIRFENLTCPLFLKASHRAKYRPRLE